MRLLQNLPIRSKLTLITMLSSGVALLLACAAFVAYELTTFRHTLSRDFAILADMFDDNAAPGLAFNDPASLVQSLKTLRAHPHILAACVYDKNGSVVAAYERNDQTQPFPFPAAQRTSSRFLKDRLDTFQDINPSGEWIGTVYLAADLEEIADRLHRYALIVVVVLTASILVAFALSRTLQKVISQPLLHLAHVAHEVASNRNYSVRAVRHGHDELGRLIGGFNEMLTEIQARDTALEQARSSLEKRVEERTADLRHENLERKRSEEALLESKSFLQSTLDALSNHIAILDATGTIIAVNAQWDQFTERFNFLAGSQGIGANYLALCEGTGRDASKAVARGIREVMARQKDRFQMEYMCDAGPGPRWLLVRATRFVGEGPIRVVVAHENITERKQTEADLAQVNKQLLETSRMAGMAEVATGVLHNVGNVLNSVNVSATLVSDGIRRGRLGHLAKAVALLHQHEHDLGDYLTQDPKGKQLLEFLTLLSEHLVQQQQSMLSEVELLRKNLDHIKEIVMMQQSYAKVSGITETLPAQELVEDSLRMNEGALLRHNIRLVREFEANPTITVDKHKVLQILINLIRNAKHACDTSGCAEKVLTLRIRAYENRLRIEVADNGVGIPPENLTRIFGHGFTTKKDGHGFGLHSGALAAKEMAGSLTVQSEGVGLGASFILELPLTPNAEGGMRSAA